MGHASRRIAKRAVGARTPDRRAGAFDADAFIGRHRRTVIVGLVFLAIAFRATYFIELNSGPWVRLHQWEQTDMNYFHRWGLAIAEGDWLSRSVGVPMHAWHHEVADRYFAAHPDVRAELERHAASLGNASTADSLLWSQWTGGHQFYQDPMHAYMIGATYALLGADPRFVLAWQMLLGVVSIVLIFRISARFFGEAVGAVAGLLAVLCGPLMYYEGLLLRDSTITCVSLAAVWLAQRAVDTRRGAWFAALGLCLGVGTMLKSSGALLAVLLAVGLALVMRRRGGTVRPVALLAMGFVVAIAPFAARNVALGVPPFAMAGSGTLTFVASNDAGYPATGGFFIPVDRLAEVLGDSGGRPVAAVLETLRAHSVQSLAALFWRRFAAAWHWYEVPNNVNFYYVRLVAPVLQWLPVTFFMLAPLGLAGLVVAARKWRETWPLYAGVLSAVISLVVFLVLGRLRLVLLAAVIPFAALAVVEAVRGSNRRRLVLGVAVLAAGLWTGRALPADKPLIELNDWLTPFLVQYKYDVERATNAGDTAGTAAAYMAFLRYEPDFTTFEREGGVLISPADREAARTFAQIHALCAQLLTTSGQAGQADTELRKADALSRLAGAR